MWELRGQQWDGVLPMTQWWVVPELAQQTHSQRCDQPGKGQERLDGKCLKPEAQQNA